MKNSELWLTPGTKRFGIVCGCAAVFLGILLMTIGFGRLLVLAVLFAAGYFLGAVKNKGPFVKKVVNRLIPDKNNETGSHQEEK